MTAADPDRELLSLSDAAGRLWGTDDEAAARRLKYLIYAREDELGGKRIMTRLRGRKRPKLRVTMAAILKDLPELRTPHRRRDDDTRKLVRAMVKAELDRAIAEIVEPQLKQIFDYINGHARLTHSKKLRKAPFRPPGNRPQTNGIDDS